MTTPAGENQLEQVHKVPKSILDRVPDWKRVYDVIFAVSVPDLRKDKRRWFVFRPATLKESQAFIQLSRVSEYGSIPTPFTVAAQNFLLRSTILYPEDLPLDEMLQGEVSALLKVIWDATGFENPEEFFGVIEEAREEVRSNIDWVIVGFICACLGFKPKEVMDMDVHTIARYVALAEMVTGKELPVGIKGRPRVTDEHRALAAMRARGGRAPQQTRFNHPQQDQLARQMPQPGPQQGVAGGVVNTSEENKLLKEYLGR